MAGISADAAPLSIGPLPPRLYTLGPEGTFSEKAARLLLTRFAGAHSGAGEPGGGDPGEGGTGEPPVEIVFTRTIPEVLARTEADGEALGVFPIENSDTGTVVFAQDALVSHKVAILQEINLRVRFSLLANAPLERVTTVLSQPVAYDQCSFFLARRMPEAQVTFTRSNTESGLHFLEERSGAPCAAIVPAEFAQEHGDVLAAEDIQNYEQNVTRFLVVRAAPGAVRHDFSRYKTSLLIEPVQDYPGLLYDLLSVFNKHRLNLCRLESRPAKVRPWTYVFFIDFNNNEHSADCLAELENGERTVTVLGSYDRMEE